jgi:hypothetical protein
LAQFDRVEQGLEAKRASIDGVQDDLPVGDVEAGEALRVTDIEVGMGRQHTFLPGPGPEAQAAVLVMTVPLNVLDAQQRHQRQVLKFSSPYRIPR